MDTRRERAEELRRECRNFMDSLYGQLVISQLVEKKERIMENLATAESWEEVLRYQAGLAMLRDVETLLQLRHDIYLADSDR